MEKGLLTLNPRLETQKIIKFLQETLQKQKIPRAVLAMSGGLDSTTTFYLLKRALPAKDIIVANLPYFPAVKKSLEKILKKAKIPPKNIYFYSLKKSVDELATLLQIPQNSLLGNVRLGNIMARVRMILLYDLAKKHNALVCGTENKSEYLLGYFTRFGDEASDLEPLRHLFKTQIYGLAVYLGVPPEIIQKPPTAGLWLGQTDKKELGASYKELDPVLYLYFEKNWSVEKIKQEGFRNAEKIVNLALRNQFKHETPYALK